MIDAKLSEAESLRKQGRLLEALDIYGRVVEEHPDYLPAQVQRMLLYFILGMPVKVESAARQVSDLDPYGADGATARAILHFLSHDFERALVEAGLAVTRDPQKQSFAHMLRAFIFRQQGLTQRAASEYAAALSTAKEVNPSSYINRIESYLPPPEPVVPAPFSLPVVPGTGVNAHEENSQKWDQVILQRPLPPQPAEDLAGDKGASYQGIIFRWPVVTAVLLSANITLFLAIELVNGWGSSQRDTILVKYGAKVNELIYQGEYWRLVTAIFLHAGWIHLLVNCISLWVVGRLFEASFGRLRYLYIYLLTGIVSSIASFEFSASISVGASGAIFGLVGALGVYFWRYRANFPAGGRPILFNWLFIVILNLMLGVALPNIDNAGHIGGLLSGLLFGLFFAPRFQVFPGKDGFHQPTDMTILRRRPLLAVVGIGMVVGLFVLALHFQVNF